MSQNAAHTQINNNVAEGYDITAVVSSLQQDSYQYNSQHLSHDGQQVGSIQGPSDHLVLNEGLLLNGQLVQHSSPGSQHWNMFDHEQSTSVSHQLSSDIQYSYSSPSQMSPNAQQFKFHKSQQQQQIQSLQPNVMIDQPYSPRQNNAFIQQMPSNSQNYGNFFPQQSTIAVQQQSQQFGHPGQYVTQQQTQNFQPVAYSVSQPFAASGQLQSTVLQQMPLNVQHTIPGHILQAAELQAAQLQQYVSAEGPTDQQNEQLQNYYNDPVLSDREFIRMQRKHVS